MNTTTLLRINELADRSEFVGYYLLKNAMLKRTADQKDYLDMIISDTTGEIPLKFWDISDMDKETFFAGSVVKVKGLVSTYRDKLQAKVIRIRLATEEDGYQVSDFVKSAPVPAADLMNVIDQTIEEIQNAKMKKIVRFCVSRVKEQLWSYPAGQTIHHNYYSGLAYHIVRMLELAGFIIKQRPFLNADLLRSGILLHDLCKVEEFQGGEQGIVTEYTVRGNLLGHISMMNTWIYEAALTFGMEAHDPVLMAIQHMVLSHHGKLEYGSPVLPQLPESVALFQIDLMDSRLQAIEDHLSNTTDPCLTGIKAVEGGRIYRLNLEETDDSLVDGL